MPFTFSHPAAVLPLTYLPRKWYSLTGLVVGSVIPDFEYFLRLRGNSAFSHTWTGVLWFDLPLAVFVAFIFHELVRNKLIDHLPLFIKTRVHDFKNFNWTTHFRNNLSAILISVVIGAASHILWDGLTHQQGLFVQNTADLRKTVSIAGRTIPLYYILQYASSVVGGLALVYAFLQWPKSREAKQGPILKYWLLVSLIAGVIIITRFLIGKGYYDFGDTIVIVLAGFIMGMVATSIIEI